MSESLDKRLEAFGRKWCTMCGEEKPLDEFHKDATKPDGHRDHCAECRQKHRAQPSPDEAIDSLEQTGREVLSGLANEGGTVTPHMSEAMESLLRPFGGIDGYGKWLFATFLAAKPGSTVRSKLLTEILNLIKAVSEQGGGDLPLEMLEDADVVRVMQTHLVEFQRKTHLPDSAVPTLDGKVTSITQEPANG